MKAKFKFVYDTILADNFALENQIIDESGCREIADIELVRFEGSPDKFLSAASDADGICAYFPMEEEQYLRIPKCKVIAAPAIGVDVFELKAATKHGICICNSPTYCVEEVAAHTAALALAAIRKVVLFDRNTRAGRWDWDDRGVMHRISGSTYGMISFGRIPQRMVGMLRGFGVKFLAWDPYLPDSVFEEYGVQRAATIEEVFSKSLIVSVHTPAFPGTHHMIGAAQFAAIPNSLILVVTSRGGRVDEDALLCALNSGKVSCAALDVIEDENTFKTVLAGHANVIMTPHIAYYSEGSNDELRSDNIRQLLDAVVFGKAPKNIVNKDVTSGFARFKG